MTPTGKTYLVTGGAGFIGSNFVKYLLETYGESIRIVILDALTYAGNLGTIAEDIARPNVEFVHGDINDATLVTDLFSRFDPDYVVNFAAESHVDRSITDPRVFLTTNVLGTQTLLDAARKAWKTDTGYREGKRYLQISTDEVYGSLERTYPTAQPLELSDELKAVTKGRADVVTFGVQLFTEDSPLAPRSPYSAAKASADMLVMAYGDTYGLPVLITRCSNNYGPYHFPEKLIPLIINNIRHGRELPVYGKGENVRDWLYVGDHVRAIDLVLRKGTPGRIYNIGGLNEQENIEIVRCIIDTYAELTGTKPRHDLIRYVIDRPGHDMRYAIDPSRTARELGWAPLTTFKDGIRRTVQWNIDHTDWIDSVTSGDYLKYYSEMYGNRIKHQS